MYVDLIKKIFVPRYNLSIQSIKKRFNLSEDSIKERVCWECGAKLNFWDYCSEFKDDKLEKMIKLWQNDYIEFYCCKCFKIKKSETLKKKTQTTVD